jgi:hypothetical protein
LAEKTTDIADLYYRNAGPVSASLITTPTTYRAKRHEP